MLSSVFLAALCASTISASPLMARQQSSAPAPAATAAATKNPTIDPQILKNLADQPTAVDRFTELLKQDPKAVPLKFDFNPAANAPFVGAGGGAVVANRKNFAPLIDLGISNAVGFMAPCSINVAHTHPRATESLTVVQGQVDSGFILENGLVREVNTTLTKFQGTVFPMGSIHFQLNQQCEDAVFVAGLNSDDPGVSTVATNFFATNPDVVRATLGFPEAIDGNNFDQFKKDIPANFARGIESCLKKCNIKA